MTQLSSKKSTLFIRFFNDKLISTQIITIQISVVILSEKNEKIIPKMAFLYLLLYFLVLGEGEPDLQLCTVILAHYHYLVMFFFQSHLPHHLEQQDAVNRLLEQMLLLYHPQDQHGNAHIVPTSTLAPIHALCVDFPSSNVKYTCM